MLLAASAVLLAALMGADGLARPHALRRPRAARRRPPDERPLHRRGADPRPPGRAALRLPARRAARRWARAAANAASRRCSNAARGSCAARPRPSPPDRHPRPRGALTRAVAASPAAAASHARPSPTTKEVPCGPFARRRGRRHAAGRRARRARPRRQPQHALQGHGASRRRPTACTVTVLNYDDRLELQNTSGEPVVIEDYDGQAVRAAARRRHGPGQHATREAFYLNDDRYGEVKVPDGPRRAAQVEAGRAAAGASSGTTTACTG